MQIPRGLTSARDDKKPKLRRVSERSQDECRSLADSRPLVMTKSQSCAELVKIARRMQIPRGLTSARVDKKPKLRRVSERSQDECRSLADSRPLVMTKSQSCAELVKDR